MTMTSTFAQGRLDLWLEAEAALSRNQSYSIDNRSLNRADEAFVERRINFWQRKVNTLLAQEAGRTNPGYKVAKLRTPAP